MRIVSVALKLTTLLAVFTFSVLPIASIQAQTYTVLHNFTNGGDGAFPVGSLTMDRSGNLYGVTGISDGSTSAGTVFRLVHRGSSWTLATLHDFVPGDDGKFDGGYEGSFVLSSKVTVGPDGSLYGVTPYGGGGPNGECIQSQPGCGVVFNLRPPATACASVLCPWTETVLYRFQGDADGGVPLGGLTFDQAGNVYGTASQGGNACDCGTVFKLTQNGGSWTYAVLYRFLGGRDAGFPASGVIFDSAGNFFGTTIYDGDFGFGTVYELSPSGSGWVERLLYQFQGSNDGGFPGGVILDPSGNLIGGSISADTDNDLGGTVYELARSGDNWTFNILYADPEDPNGGFGGAFDTLLLDPSGNLYGTTACDGDFDNCTSDDGKVFKLTPFNGGWSETDLHVFTGSQNGLYGETPAGGAVRDTNGNLYGATRSGGTGVCGSSGCGLVYEITP